MTLSTTGELPAFGVRLQKDGGHARETESAWHCIAYTVLGAVSLRIAVIAMRACTSVVGYEVRLVSWFFEVRLDTRSMKTW